jgi:dihydroorotate dehydrogenase (fumarate)
VKIGPYFAALPNFARRISDAGAQGLVMFNRFLEPEIDIDRFTIEPHLELSEPRELRLPLRWIGILYKQLPLSLAASSGIHDAKDVIKALLAGANVATVASTLLKHGPQHVNELLAGLEAWMQAKNFNSLADIRGLMSRHNYGKPAQFERANYMEAIASFSKVF